jgi:gamma-D-glutamyl-L-lysine dipeptidyl-peptidase
MDYAIITVPATPVRRKPSHDSEMVSQLLFGEFVLVIKKKNDRWAKIRSLHDDYEGWVTLHILTALPDKPRETGNKHVVDEILGKLIIKGQDMYLPFGSILPAFDNGEGMAGGLSFQFNGRVKEVNTSNTNAAVLVDYAMRWLNVPYMWGGRTPLGADCSGFVQVMARMAGIDLPRDTWQQASTGEKVDKLRNAKPGDLAFFEKEDRIIHVGILLDHERIIHAFGKVRIDTITEKGLIIKETGKMSHSLNVIRRIL